MREGYEFRRKRLSFSATEKGRSQFFRGIFYPLSGRGSTADDESTATSYDMEEEAMTDENREDGEESRKDSREDDGDSRWKRLLPTVYAVLRRLEVNLKLASSLVVVPRASIFSAPPSAFLASFESLCRQKLLPHCLCFVTPSVEISSASGKDFLIDDGGVF